MRAAGAVIAGYVLWSVIWVAGGFGLGLAFPAEAAAWAAGEPITSVAYLLLALVLSVACSLAAGRTNRALRQAGSGPLWIMAGLLLATGVGVQASAWSRMPLWYHVTFLGLIVPLIALGGGGQGRTGRTGSSEAV